MLEGYGVFKTTENDTNKIDEFTPLSKYYLESTKVRRLTHYFNLTLSYSFRNFNLFYNYFLFSPETKLGLLNELNPSRPAINVGKRYHAFAEIGINFKL